MNIYFYILNVKYFFVVVNIGKSFFRYVNNIGTRLNC